MNTSGISQPALLSNFIALINILSWKLQTFTADELRTALSGVMSSLNISAGPPSKPVTPEDFKAAFAAAVGNLRRVCDCSIQKAHVV